MIDSPTDSALSFGVVNFGKTMSTLVFQIRCKGVCQIQPVLENWSRRTLARDGEQNDAAGLRNVGCHQTLYELDVALAAALADAHNQAYLKYPMSFSTPRPMKCTYPANRRKTGPRRRFR